MALVLSSSPPFTTLLGITSREFLTPLWNITALNITLQTKSSKHS